MTEAALLVLDGLLVVVIVSLAWAILESRDLQRGVVLFIAFGLVLAVVWARLAAPDIALAEAAIGAGLSGVLLLSALRDEPPTRTPQRPDTLRRAGGRAVSVLCLALGAGIAVAYVTALVDTDPARLGDWILAETPNSGVSNPVTAVLLNFRAYDTLLELAVLLVALLGIISLGPARGGYQPAGPVLARLVHWLTPALILSAGYLLWVGAHAPGGAFQAGTLLAAAAVLLRLSGDPSAGLPPGLALRAVAVAGVALFLVVGLALMIAGQPFLGYPSAWAGVLILLIESAATLAIAATLALAFVGGRPRDWSRVGDPGESS